MSYARNTWMSGRWIRRTAALVAAALASVALTGCPDGDDEPVQWSAPCPEQPGSSLTLVVGARANSPRAQLTDEVRTLIRQAAVREQKVQVVRVDGVPTVALTATFKNEGKNQPIRDRNLQNFVQQTTQFLGDLQPKEPEADLLGALTEAGQITPDGGTIVVLDSGLATVGPLSFRNANMFGAAPEEVVTFLGDQDLMPDLGGRAVVFLGLGETADPQPPLVGSPHKLVGELWQTVAREAGAACVHELRTTLTRAAISTTVPVTVVEPPAPPVWPKCGTTVLADSSPVGFKVGEAEFRDPAAAKATLRALAQTLTGGSQRVTLTGTTSSEGSAGDNQTLSERRAAAVKKVLVELGVAADRVTARGAGEKWPDRKVDMTRDGVLIPTAAAYNRSVVVRLSCQS